MNKKDILNKVLNKENLSLEEAYYVMNNIFRGEYSEGYIGALLIALKCKGESIDELTGFAKAMKDNAVSDFISEGDSLDIVGTGGDNLKTFNISSISSFVIAASDIKVAKHGNRSVSSLCGSADLFENLGVNINLEPDKTKDIFEKIGISFLFAQKYHNSMKYVAPVRKDLGIRTVFNILGPLTNPANSNQALIGVYDINLVSIFAKVLRNLGMKKALIVYGFDGLDEISLSNKTKIAKLDNGIIEEFIFDPRDYGYKLCQINELVGGSVIDNTKIALGILDGSIKGAKRDCVVINSGFAISLAKSISLEEAFKEAEYLIDSKIALNKLNDYVRLSNDLR